MKKLVLGAVAVAMLAGLAGCQNKQEAGTLIGMGAGGLLGSQFGGGTSGHILGALGGTLIGGLIGGEIGKYMDKQDQINMQSAIVNTPVNQSASWTNNQSGTTYVVTPTKNFNQGGQYCREYQTKITVGGKVQTAYGQACRQPDGTWQIVS